MANVFAITAAVDRVALGADRRARTSFTVSNMTDQPIAARARAVPDNQDAGRWFTVSDPEREVHVGETQQFSVDIAVPRNAPAGEYVFRLDVVSVENPDEEFAQGPGVVVVVPEAEIVSRRRFPWWIVAAAGAALLIVTIIVIWLLRDSDEDNRNDVIAESTATAVPTVVKGVYRLEFEDPFDLDSGERGDRSTTGDIEVVYESRPDREMSEALRLHNNAQAGVFGPDAPGFDGCRTMHLDIELGTESIPVADVQPDNHLCVLTSEDNLAEVLIVNVELLQVEDLPFRRMRVDMTFTTFEGT